MGNRAPKRPVLTILLREKSSSIWELATQSKDLLDSLKEHKEGVLESQKNLRDEELKCDDQKPQS